MKVCSKCKMERPLSLYGSKLDAPSGLRYECKICQRAREREHYRRSPHRNKRRIKDVRREEERHKRYGAKRTAMQSVRYAVKAGKIKRDNCCVCRKLHGKEVRAHGHHNDYNKVLELTWLCSAHHRAWHRIFLAEQPAG